MDMEFKEQEIQQEVNRIQREENSPDFMRVQINTSYYLDNERSFRDELSDMAFFTPIGKERAELLTELSKAIIQKSL